MKARSGLSPMSSGFLTVDGFKPSTQHLADFDRLF
jgi:hypothetical protein